MTMNSKTANPRLQRFESSRLWKSNVCGAAVAGIGTGILLCIVAGIIISGGQGFDGAFLFAAVIIGSVILTLLCMYPGNQIAAYPYAVELEEGRGLRLLAPLKSVYIPIKEVKGIRRSFLALGWIVSLGRRHGLLKGFVIHGGFGGQGRALARAIQEEVMRRGLPQSGN